MRFTLSWLKDHLKTRASLEKIADTLTVIGLEVEDIENPAEKFAPFTVARVVSAEQHPDADRLKVLQVDTGGETVQIICGAPNARAGMKGVFAPVGTYVPGIDLMLKSASIRGVMSNGMLCSEREMELSDEHDGIIELPAGAKIGTPFAKVMGLDDPVIEVAITPNRPDALGVRGIARDLAAAGLGKLKDDPNRKLKAKGDCPVPIDLKFDAADAHICPVFAGCYVAGVKNGPSPAWLQQRLRAIGLRPINTLVDITNYISYDRGRPLHVYDADKLVGTIHARMGRRGEKFMALDGHEYEVDETMCVIADDENVLGLGGIMGGEDTGCTADTVNVLIESAWFDPVNVAMTGRRFQIVSDARYRFERGVDPASVLPGCEMGANMISDLCGGTPSRLRIAGEAPSPKTVVQFRAKHEIKRLTGRAVPEKKIISILENLGFKVNPADKNDHYAVTAPSWRPDIHGSADLVEEVVRIIGVDAFPAASMPRQQGVAKPVLTVRQKRVARARRILAGRGMTEAITWSFIPRPQARLFGGGGPDLELANPISVEMSSMRPNLFAGLVTAAQRNRDRGFADTALFEVGQSYRGDKPEDQYISAAGLRVGTARPAGAARHWSGSASPADLFDVKADALAVLCGLGLKTGQVQITRDAPQYFHPGHSGTVRLGPKMILAHFGEVHPMILEKLDASGPASAFEVFIDRLPRPKRLATHTRAALEITDLQPVRRDFAFLLDRDTPAGDVIRAARGADRQLINDVTVFDLFEGEALGPHKKSLAIEVTLQPLEKTLTDNEIEAVAAKIVTAVEKATGGEIRG